MYRISDPLLLVCSSSLWDSDVGFHYVLDTQIYGYGRLLLDNKRPWLHSSIVQGLLLECSMLECNTIKAGNKMTQLRSTEVYLRSIEPG